MAQRARIRRLFPGGNTARGFYSLHRHVACPLANRVFILKGGPGAGKSTLLRRLAGEFWERGWEVEHHCCSSDRASLDGLYVPALGMAVLDGTPPHVIDPASPGAVEELVNLGDCWDGPALRRDRAAIEALGREVASQFQHAYRCLACALAALEHWEGLVREAAEGSAPRVWALAAELAAEVRSAAAGGGGAGTGPAWERHLFATAISPGGPVGYLGDLVEGLGRRWVLVGPPGAGGRLLVSTAVQAAREAVTPLEVYRCALGPDRVDHVVLPAAGLAVLTASPLHEYRPAPEDRVVDATELLSPAALRRLDAELGRARGLYESALAAAVAFLDQAKEAHDRLEARYIPHLDFEAVGRRGRDILERTLAEAPRRDA